MPFKDPERKREYDRERKKGSKGVGIIATTQGEPKSTKPYAPKMTQGKLAQSSYKGPAFSHLKRNEDRDQDEKSESPPTPRRWASP